MRIINHLLSYLGGQAIFFVQEMGRIAVFLGKSFVYIFTLPFQGVKILYQIHFIGAKSLFIITLTAVFTGMVLGLQGYYVLVKYGSAGSIGTAVAISLIREMGPVLTAIMLTARAGSAIAAEIGIMRISEQIDALETMDINPIRFLVSPKLAGALVSFPLLTAFFDVMGILGGYATGSILLGVSSGVYFAGVNSSVTMNDISSGFIKSIVFAIVVNTICCFQGYYTHTRTEGFGAKGVSLATTSAVVLSCVLILVTDYVITSLLL